MHMAVFLMHHMFIPFWSLCTLLVTLHCSLHLMLRSFLSCWERVRVACNRMVVGRHGCGVGDGSSANNGARGQRAPPRHSTQEYNKHTEQGIIQQQRVLYPQVRVQQQPRGTSRAACKAPQDGVDSSRPCARRRTFLPFRGDAPELELPRNALVKAA